MRERKRKKRIRYVGRRYSIRGLLLFLMLALTAFFFLHSPYFNVSAIAVTGNSTLSKPAARSLSGISRGTNIFRVDTGAVEEKMKLNPFVASVKVERDLPQTICLTIVEYKPIAVIPVGEGFIQISKEGYCLKQCSEIGSLDMPVISGLGLKKTVPPGAKVENKRLPVAVEILKHAQEKGIVAEVDVHDPLRLNMFTFSKTKILLGNKDQLAEKITLALDIASKVPGAQYIDVRFPKSPVYK